MNSEASASAQRRREEQDRLALIDENYEAALDHFPEGFGSIIMLYIPCKVNDKPLKAYVDTGAQVTISLCHGFIWLWILLTTWFSECGNC